DPASKRAGLARVGLQSGAATALYDQEKKYGGYTNRAAVTPDKQSVMYIAEDGSHPAELWRALASNARPPQQVSEFAPELAKFAFGKTGLIEWRGVDGNVLRG